MPLSLKKQQRYQELKKKYGFDIAVLKQTHQPISDEELYKSLLLFDLQNTLTDSINNYVEDIEAAPEEISALVALLFNTSGEIVAELARHNPSHLLLLRKEAISQFDYHLKDFLNGKSKDPIS